ncbi:MAG: extracellular solute-binding protein [Spirochaetes bacterium]|nr:extracellular solute-binding protein [Spirochaetota bacterium]
MKRLVVLLLVALAVAPALMAQVTPETLAGLKTTNLQMWTKEGEADGALQYVQYLADLFSKIYPKISIEVVNKNVEVLREDFQTASLAGMPPDLLWTVNDQAGPFTAAKLIQPVDTLFVLSNYVTSAVNAVKLAGKTWGVPITNGNHLMLMYNKQLIAKPPATTNELFALVGKLPAGVYPLVYNQTEPFWLVPWLGGFKGAVFAADGKTPTLNTPAMVSTLTLLKQMKDKGLVPAESDYNAMDTLFKEGKAALIINGDWSLGGYRDALGEDFGVARIPLVSATGVWPAPYTSGAYFMIPVDTTGSKLTAVRGFIQFATTRPMQLEMLKRRSILPALKSALTDEDITSNALLKNSADQMVVGTPMPTVLEMRAVWDAMKPELAAVLSGAKTPQAAAAAMQNAAVTGIKKLQ